MVGDRFSARLHFKLNGSQTWHCQETITKNTELNGPVMKKIHTYIDISTKPINANTSQNAKTTFTKLPRLIHLNTLK